MAPYYRSKQRWWLLPIGHPKPIHSNFSSIFTRFRDIAMLEHATFPTPRLVSPKFPHVPLGVGGWLLSCEERRWWAIVHAISFQDFQPMWSWSTNATDGRTDRRTTCNLNTAFCTAFCIIVHRAVKINDACSCSRHNVCSHFSSNVGRSLIGKSVTCTHYTRYGWLITDKRTPIHCC